MAFTKYTKDTTIIGALGTNPAERALTTQEFKDKFDQFADEFVAWFNETHLPEVAEKAELEGLAGEDRTTETVKKNADDIAAHLAETASVESKTYYIDATNGNDSNNGLTAGTAVKTWTKTESLIPHLIKHQYTIKIIGNLPEVIVLRGRIASFGENGIIIEGNTTTPSNQVISGIQIVSCVCGGWCGVEVKNLQIAGSINIVSSMGVNVQNCNPRNPAGAGIAIISSTARISDCDFGTEIVQDAIVASACSTVLCSTNTGIATRYGLLAQHASALGKYNTQPTGKTANEFVFAGGVIRQ